MEKLLYTYALPRMHPYIAVPATVALVLRAYLKKSLTPAGLVAAGATAVIHALHPWSVFYALLVVFFLGGTTVTKVLSPPHPLPTPHCCDPVLTF